MPAQQWAASNVRNHAGAARRHCGPGCVCMPGQAAKRRGKGGTPLRERCRSAELPNQKRTVVDVEPPDRGVGLRQLDEVGQQRLAAGAPRGVHLRGEAGRWVLASW